MLFSKNRLSIALAAWALVILTLSILPGESLPSYTFWEFLSLDKIGHLIVYAILAALAILVLWQQFAGRYSRLSLVAIAIFVTILYGFIIELVQGMILAGRYFEMMDILANIIGVMTGTFIINLLYLKNKIT